MDQRSKLGRQHPSSGQANEDQDFEYLEIQKQANSCPDGQLPQYQLRGSYQPQTDPQYISDSLGCQDPQMHPDQINQNYNQDTHLKGSTGSRYPRNLAMRRDRRDAKQPKGAGKPPLPVSQSPSKGRHSLPVNSMNADLMSLKFNPTVSAKVAAAPSSGQADRQFTPSEKYEFDRNQLRVHQQEHQLADPQHQKAHQTRGSKYPESSHNPSKSGHDGQNGKQRHQQDPAFQGISIQGTHHPAKKPQGGAVITTSHSQRSMKNAQNSNLFSPGDNNQGFQHQNFMHSSRNVKEFDSDPAYHPSAQHQRDPRYSHHQTLDQGEARGSVRDGNLKGKKQPRLHSFDERLQQQQRQQRDSEFYGKPHLVDIQNEKNVYRDEARRLVGSEHSHDLRLRQQSYSQKIKPVNFAEDGHHNPFYAESLSEVKHASYKEMPRLHSQQQQSRGTSKKSNQLLDDPIQTAQRIMRQQRLPWQQKRSVAGGAQANQNRLYIQKHMSEQLKSQNLSNTDSRYSHEQSNMRSPHSRSRPEDEILLSPGSHESYNQSHNSGQSKHASNQERPQNGRPSTESLNNRQIRQNFAHNHQTKQASNDRNKNPQSNEMKEQEPSRPQFNEKANRQRPDANQSNPSKDKRMHPSDLQLERRAFSQDNLNQQMEDGEKQPGYDFSFQYVHPSNSFVANEQSSQAAKREVFGVLAPNIVNSEPLAKDSSRQGEGSQKMNAKKQKASKNGINMNIEKYNERRQAKMVRMQKAGGGNLSGLNLVMQPQLASQVSQQSTTDASQSVKQMNQNSQKNLGQIREESRKMQETGDQHPQTQQHRENQMAAPGAIIASSRSAQSNNEPRQTNGSNHIGQHHFAGIDGNAREPGRNQAAAAPPMSQRNAISKHSLDGRQDRSLKSERQERSHGLYHGHRQVQDDRQASEDFTHFDPNIFKHHPSMRSLLTKKHEDGKAVDQVADQQHHPKTPSNHMGIGSVRSHSNGHSSSKSGSRPGGASVGADRHSHHSSAVSASTSSHHDRQYSNGRVQASKEDAWMGGADRPDRSPASQAPSEGCSRFNIITKFAFATSCGYQPGNPNKKNQDSYVLEPNMLDQLGLHFFSVCDGHGVHGELVSGYVRDNLANRVKTLLSKSGGLELRDQAGIGKFHQKIPKYMHKSIHQIQSELANPSVFKFDSQMSGTTCCSVLFDRNTVFGANLGDSRAVLYSIVQPGAEYKAGHTGKLGVTPLSRDHKPSLPMESERIMSCGGRVEALKGPMGQSLGPQRVWLKDQEFPGLAMSRSLGDMIAHSVGVSTDPEVIKVELQPEHKFVVIASDGVWEFLSNEEIGQIAWPFYQENSPEQAGNAIVRAAAQKWRENDSMIDDITCITIFLEVDQQVPTIESGPHQDFQSRHSLSSKSTRKSVPQHGTGAGKAFRSPPQSSSNTKNQQIHNQSKSKHPIIGQRERQATRK